MARVLARLVANQACIALSVKVLCRCDLAAGKRDAKMAKSHDLLVASLRIVLHLSQTRSESLDSNNHFGTARIAVGSQFYILMTIVEVVRG